MSLAGRVTILACGLLLPSVPQHRIVVLGAGYAGALSAGYLARQLHSDDFDITVVNAEPDFVERLRLHQLAAGQELRHRSLAMCSRTPTFGSD